MKRTMRPGVGSALALGVEGSDFFCPFEGGTLELSGVFAGRPSLASSSASRAVKAATCAISEAISASFCACERCERFGPAAMNPEIRIRCPRTRPYKLTKSISRSHHVSNYRLLEVSTHDYVARLWASWRRGP